MKHNYNSDMDYDSKEMPHGAMEGSKTSEYGGEHGKRWKKGDFSDGVPDQDRNGMDHGLKG